MTFSRKELLTASTASKADSLDPEICTAKR